DRGDGAGHAGDAVGGGAGERVRGAAAEREDPGAGLSPADRRHAGGRRHGQPRGQGIHLLRHGLFALRRDAQSALPEESPARPASPPLRGVRLTGVWWPSLPSRLTRPEATPTISTVRDRRRRRSTGSTLVPFQLVAADEPKRVLGRRRNARNPVLSG